MSQPSEPPSPDETFGQLLCRLRETRGLSKIELARRTSVSQPSLSKYEYGRSVPNTDAAERLDTALEAHGTLRELADLERATIAHRKHAYVPQPVPDGEIMPLNRRKLLSGVALAAGISAAAPEALARLLDGLTNLDRVPTRVGLREVQAIEEATNLFMTRGGKSLPSALDTEQAFAALRWGSNLLSAPMTSDVRSRMSSALGLLGDRVGWELYDQDRVPLARKLLTFALGHASHGEDRDLRAHVLLDMGTIENAMGNSRQGIDLLQLALGDVRVSSAERANLHSVAAQCCGPAGELEAGLRHVAEAEEELAKANPALAPDWARQITYDPGHLDGALALSLHALGDVNRTRDRVGAALSTLGEGRTRTRLRCRVRQTAVDLRTGNRAAAEAEGRAVLRDAAGISSRRIRRDLVMLRDDAMTFGMPDLAHDFSKQLAGV